MISYMPRCMSYSEVLLCMGFGLLNILQMSCSKEKRMRVKPKDPPAMWVEANCYTKSTFPLQKNCL